MSSTFPALDRRAGRRPEGDLSGGTVTDRSPSGLDGTLANPGAATTAEGDATTRSSIKPVNGNTLTFDVTAPRNGAYAMTVRYSNPEQSPASHYDSYSSGTFPDILLRSKYAPIVDRIALTPLAR
ncbi:hypothetical protein [Nonomuraea sp. NPDC003201]